MDSSDYSSQQDCKLQPRISLRVVRSNPHPFRIYFSMAELTVHAALKAQVQYPLPTEFFASVMIRRGLDGDEVCTQEIITSTKFKGAVADCLRQLVIYPQSISQGGVSISKADRDSLLSEANRLYRSIGEDAISLRPKITCY